MNETNYYVSFRGDLHYRRFRSEDDAIALAASLEPSGEPKVLFESRSGVFLEFPESIPDLICARSSSRAALASSCTGWKSGRSVDP